MKNSEWPLNQFHHVHLAAQDIRIPESILTPIGIPIAGYNHPGKFQVMEGMELDEFWARDYKFCRVGDVHFQFMSPNLPGDYRNFLDEHNNRVNSIGFVVDDVEKAEEELLSRGLKVKIRARHDDGWGFTYFDTLDLVGALMTVRQSARGENLTEENTSTGHFSNMGEIQFVVNNLPKVEAAFEKTGITFTEDAGYKDVADVRGISAAAFDKMTSKIAVSGGMRIRLTSSGETDSPIGSFGAAFSKRPFSLGFTVDDLATAEKFASENGLTTLFKVEKPDGSGVCTFDTLKQIGINLAIHKVA